MNSVQCGKIVILALFLCNCLILPVASYSGDQAANYIIQTNGRAAVDSVTRQASLPGTPHLVGGYLAYADGSHPANATWNAFITSRPAEVITQDSAGSRYDGAASGGFVIQCEAFSDWAAGDTLHADFSDGLGATAFIDVVLTTNPGDIVGTVVLTRIEYSQITITTDPIGLDFIADGVVYTAPHIFTWEVGTVHTLDLSSLQVSAQPGVRYLFASWSDGGAQEHNYTTLQSSQTLTADFTTQYYLTMNSVYGNPQGEGWYNSGVSAQFGVTSPAAGTSGTQFVFTGWTGSGAGSYSGAQAINTIIMNNPVTETAGWKTQYLLTTSVEPAESGSVTPNPVGPWFDAGEFVTLTAVPNSGYQWAGWSGSLSGIANPVAFLMDEPKSVTAQFSIGDNTPPVLIYLYPGDSTHSVPVNSELQFKVADAGDGVNLASLDLTVNLEPILVNGIDQTGGRAMIHAADKGCTIFYQPAEDYPANSDVPVTIYCEDLSPLANDMNQEVQFQTGAGRMIYAFTDTLDSNGGMLVDDSTGFVLEAPFQAASEAVVITIAMVDQYPALPLDQEALAEGMYFGPAGIRFADSVTITIPCTPDILNRANVTDAAELPVYFYSMIEGQWSSLTISDIDERNLYARVKEGGYLVYGKKAVDLPKPGRPAGQVDLLVDALYGFETTRVDYIPGHGVEYRFDWGDGSFSAWADVVFATHVWTAEGVFGIVAMARSQDDPTIVSYSDTLHVVVTNSSAIMKDNEIPTDFQVQQNYPNPFNPETRIRYQIPVSAYVSMEIYNINGQKIRALVNKEQPAGYHSAIWDGRNDAGMAVSAGLYFMQVRAGEYVETIKMSLLK